MKNKIFKYDFLIVGGGLIGSLAAIALLQKKFKVLVIEKNISLPNDQRTLAVNANSRNFLKKIGLWEKLKFEQEPINKILILFHESYSLLQIRLLFFELRFL